MPRHNNRDRRRARLRTRPLLLVVCAAERTECDYLWALRDSVRESPVDIQVVSKHKSPDAVVSYAATRASDARASYDEIWCVFDVDQYDRSVEIAKRKAAERGIRLAVSDPCFEAAIRRAEKLGDEVNPSTGMWRLAVRIRDEEGDT